MVSVYETCSDKRTIPINSTNPTPWGGVAVDGNLLNLVTRIFGKTVVDAFKAEAVSE